MALGGWLIESVFKFTGLAQGAAGMERFAAATDRAAIGEARLRGELTAQEAAFLRLHASQEKALASRRQLFNEGTTKAATAGFIGLAAGIGYAIDQASILQRHLTAIANETGADPAKIAKFYDASFAIGNRIGVSPAVASDMLLNISRLTAGQMQTSQMLTIAPAIADFASVLHFNRPDVSVEAALGAGLQSAHLFRAYTDAAIRPLLDNVYRMSGLMRESPDQANRQLTYYEPLFKGVRINDQQSIGMMALLDRAGFRNRVGTGVRAMMLEMMGTLQTTSHAQAGKMALLGEGDVQIGPNRLRGMGLYHDGKATFTDSAGNVNFLGAMEKISNWAKWEETHGIGKMQVQDILFSVFGKQGGNIASLMADPVMVGILRDIAKYQKDPNVSLQAAIQRREGTLPFQFGRAVSNLQAVFTEIGWHWVQPMTGFFKSIADDAHDFQAFMHANKQFGDTIAVVLPSLTAFLGIVAAGGAVGNALKFLGIVKELPNAFMLVTWPMRMVVTGLWATATGGTAAGPALMTVAGGIRAAGGAALAATAPFAALVSELAVVASVAGLFIGMSKNLNDAKNNPKVGALMRWGASGANSGQAPPGTDGTVDVFGRPLPGYVSPSNNHSGSFWSSKSPGSGRPNVSVVNHIHIH